MPREDWELLTDGEIQEVDKGRVPSQHDAVNGLFRICRVARTIENLPDLGNDPGTVLEEFV